MSTEANGKAFIADYYVEADLSTTSKADIDSAVSHHRAYVGPPEKYDVIGAVQFHALVGLGLREYHTVLDIGCGSLRGGQFLIQYLQSEHYYGIEPEVWLVEEGVQNEVGQELVQRKHPRFSANRDFDLSVFDQKFDFLLAQSIFSHASDWQVKQCLQQAQQVLYPTGIFAATFYQAETNSHSDDYYYLGNSQYRFDWMQQVAAEVGLHCRWMDWPHPNGQTWILFTPQNNAINIPTIQFRTSTIPTAPHGVPINRPHIHAPNSVDHTQSPNFLIIGAQKSGTTSLHICLQQHPNIVMTDVKELHYFDSDKRYPNHSAYEANFPRLSEFVQATGETTPDYCMWPQAIKRIADYNPRMRLIMILRDPMVRAVSGYWWTYVNNHEKLPILEAFQQEADRLKRGDAFSLLWHSYLLRGRYHEQLDHIFQFFPRENVHVLRFEDLIQTPQLVLNQITDFLEVDPFEVDVFPFHLKNEHPEPDAAVVDFLHEYFAPHNAALQSKYGIAWYNP